MLNSNGVVKDIKINKFYVVFVNDRDKHISGDHMSLIYNNNVKDIQVIPDDNLYDSDENLDISDNISVDYDSDDDVEPISQTISNVINNVNDNNVQRRHYRNEAQKLQDNLSNIYPESRL